MPHAESHRTHFGSQVLWVNTRRFQAEFSFEYVSGHYNNQVSFKWILYRTCRLLQKRLIEYRSCSRQKKAQLIKILTIFTEDFLSRYSDHSMKYTVQQFLTLYCVEPTARPAAWQSNYYPCRKWISRLGVCRVVKGAFVNCMCSNTAKISIVSSSTQERRS